MNKAKIGVLGTGDVGRRLATGFTSLGHDVMMGTRNPQGEKPQVWVAGAGEHASAGTFEECAKFGEILVLATLWSGTQSALELAGPDNFAGKVLLDATNPLVFSPNAPPALALGHTDSGGEQVQRWVPKARVVKAYNTVGNPLMVHPDLPGGPPDMFICGNDADAKTAVTEICKAFGWPAIDLGGIEASRYLEPLAMIWITYGIRTNTWMHAFKLLKK